MNVGARSAYLAGKRPENRFGGSTTWSSTLTMTISLISIASLLHFPSASSTQVDVALGYDDAPSGDPDLLHCSVRGPRDWPSGYLTLAIGSQTSTAMMSAPSWARRMAWLRPWHRAAPVMSSTLPSSFPTCSLPGFAAMTLAVRLHENVCSRRARAPRPGPAVLQQGERASGPRPSGPMDLRSRFRGHQADGLSPQR